MTGNLYTVKPITVPLLSIQRNSAGQPKCVWAVWIGPRIEPQIPEDVLIRRGCTARYDLRPGQQQIFEDLDRTLGEAAAAQWIAYVSQIAATDFDMAHDFMTCEALYWSDGDHWTSAGAARFVGRMIAADALPLP